MATIEFDPKTYTEPGCDTLQIFSDPEMKNELTQKMSGRHPKWGSITTKSHHLTFHFCSDGSVTEWGYRAIITAKFIATRYFCSPNSYFDLSYSISEMLFSFAKSINDFDKNNGVNFNIPHDVLTRNISNERKTELKEILKDQIDTSILDFPTLTGFASIWSVLEFVYCLKDVYANIKSNENEQDKLDIKGAYTQFGDGVMIFASCLLFLTNQVPLYKAISINKKIMNQRTTDLAHLEEKTLVYYLNVNQLVQSSMDYSLLSISSAIQALYKRD